MRGKGPTAARPTPACAIPRLVLPCSGLADGMYLTLPYSSYRKSTWHSRHCLSHGTPGLCPASSVDYAGPIPRSATVARSWPHPPGCDWLFTRIAHEFSPSGVTVFGVMVTAGYSASYEVYGVAVTSQCNQPGADTWKLAADSSEYRRRELVIHASSGIDSS